MHYAIDFAPHLPMVLLCGLGLLALAVGHLRARPARARGVDVRFWLSPWCWQRWPIRSWCTRAREPLPDVVALIVDHSPSMDIRGRRSEADKAAAAAARDAVARQKPGDPRSGCDRRRASARIPARRLFAALRNALADVPPDRVAGAIALTDGEVHDVPAGTALKAPFHALIVDRRDEKDRKLTVVECGALRASSNKMRISRCGSTISVRRPGGVADVDVRVDGEAPVSAIVQIGHDVHVQVPIRHGGENVIELSARPGSRPNSRWKTTAPSSSSTACATACACCSFPANPMPANACGAIC